MKVEQVTEILNKHIRAGEGLGSYPLCMWQPIQEDVETIVQRIRAHVTQHSHSDDYPTLEAMQEMASQEWLDGLELMAFFAVHQLLGISGCDFAEEHKVARHYPELELFMERVALRAGEK